jgi:hypothetical protein
MRRRQDTRRSENIERVYVDTDLGPMCTNTTKCMSAGNMQSHWNVSVKAQRMTNSPALKIQRRDHAAAEHPTLY